MHSVHALSPSEAGDSIQKWPLGVAWGISGTQGAFWRTITLAAAALVPWFSYEDYTWSLGHFSRFLLPHFGVATQRPLNGPSLLYLPDRGLVYFFLSGLLFWVPLLELLEGIGTTKPETESTKLMWVMCPAGITLCIWLIMYFQGWTPALGLWLVLSAPVVMLIQARLRKAIGARRRPPVPP